MKTLKLKPIKSVHRVTQLIYENVKPTYAPLFSSIFQRAYYSTGKETNLQQIVVFSTVIFCLINFTLGKKESLKDSLEN